MWILPDELELENARRQSTLESGSCGAGSDQVCSPKRSRRFLSRRRREYNLPGRQQHGSMVPNFDLIAHMSQSEGHERPPLIASALADQELPDNGESSRQNLARSSPIVAGSEDSDVQIMDEETWSTEMDMLRKEKERVRRRRAAEDEELRRKDLAKAREQKKKEEALPQHQSKSNGLSPAARAYHSSRSHTVGSVQRRKVRRALDTAYSRKQEEAAQRTAIAARDTAMTEDRSSAERRSVERQAKLLAVFMQEKQRHSASYPNNIEIRPEFRAHMGVQRTQRLQNGLAESIAALAAPKPLSQRQHKIRPSDQPKLQITRAK